MNVGNVFCVEKNQITSKVANLLSQGFIEINIMVHPKNPESYYVTASKTHMAVKQTMEESDFMH